MISPHIGPREPLYKNQHQEIYKINADFGAYTKEYYVSDTGRRAGMVAIKENCILLVRQYRLLIDDLSWEIPGGKVDDGETPLETAVRECQEETGIICLNPRPLLFYHVGLDTTYNPTYLFFCDELTEEPGAQGVNPQEIHRSEWVALSRCVDMIFNRQILDSFSILAILTYRSFIEPPAGNP